MAPACTAIERLVREPLGGAAIVKALRLAYSAVARGLWRRFFQAAAARWARSIAVTAASLATSLINRLSLGSRLEPGHGSPEAAAPRRRSHGRLKGRRRRCGDLPPARPARPARHPAPAGRRARRRVVAAAGESIEWSQLQELAPARRGAHKRAGRESVGFPTAG